MGKGKRYDGKQKLNLKKVFGVLVALVVIIMIIFSIIKAINNNNNIINKEKITYFTIYSNNKFGVIDNKGTIIIEPTYDEMIVIPNKTQPLFVCTYEVNDTDGTYKAKAINDKNEQKFTDYEKVEAIENFDSKQNIWYEDNVLRVVKNGFYGLINFNGDILLPCEYTEITALKGVKNNILVTKDGKVGLVNEQGQTIVPIEYKNILSMKEEYKNEYIIVNSDNKYGVISTSGKIIIETKYDLIKYLNVSNLYAAKENNVLKLINSEGQVLVESGYDDIIQAKGENVIIIKSGKYGAIDLTGAEKISATYDDLKYAGSIYYIAKKDGKYGIINLDNETIIPFEYTSITYVEKGDFYLADKSETETIVFDNNLAQKFSGIISQINTDKGYIKSYINNEYKYYNFKFEEKQSKDILTSNTLFLSKKNGKYGYTDKNSKVVVDYIYDDGTEQNEEGYAAVKKDGNWGSINKIGALSLETTINLDSNIYLDFIGEWHLADNGLYYTK